MIDLDTRPWTRIDASGDCWLWTGHTAGGGYGRTGWPVRMAHRVIFEALVGPIPARMTLDHLCRVPTCVNPDHLQVVSERDNILRGFAPPALNARKTHCRRGHPLAGENVTLYRGTRRCRACQRMFDQTYKSRRKEARAAA